MNTYFQIITASPALFYLAINLIVALPALFISFKLDNKRTNRYPNTLTFKWGYFTGSRILMASTIITILGIIIIASGEPDLAEVNVAIIWALCVLFIPGILILRRNRWAWIFYTIFSFNPFLWLINSIYIKNRWNEFARHTDDSMRQVIENNLPSTQSEIKPPTFCKEKPNKSKKKGCLVTSLVLLVVIIVIVPISLLVFKNWFINYAKKMGEERPLYIAAVLGDIEKVDRLIDRGANTNEKGLKGHTPLIAVTRSHHSLIADHLLTAGADPNQKDDFGWAPLHHAVKTDTADCDIMSILVKHGADVNVRDGFHRTPLHRAAQFGHVDAVIFLLKVGADPTAKDENGWTPLDRGRAHPAIVEILSKY